jgi:hypothetical protein
MSNVDRLSDLVNNIKKLLDYMEGGPRVDSSLLSDELQLASFGMSYLLSEFNTKGGAITKILKAHGFDKLYAFDPFSILCELNKIYFLRTLEGQMSVWGDVYLTGFGGMRKSLEEEHEDDIASLESVLRVLYTKFSRLLVSIGQ